MLVLSFFAPAQYDIILGKGAFKTVCVPLMHSLVLLILMLDKGRTDLYLHMRIQLRFVFLLVWPFLHLQREHVTFSASVVLLPINP